MKTIILENLTEDTVGILIIAQGENEDVERWRVALLNTDQGRIQLQDALKPYPKELNEVLSVWGKKPTMPGPEDEPIPIETLRQAKLAEIGAAREAVINAGVKVETSQGEHNFSLTDRDQMNLNAMYGALVAALAGMPSPVDPEQGIWYHADGEPHAFWGNEDFIKICLTALPFIAGQITYYKDLRRHVERLETAEEIAAIFYGMVIPDA